MRPTSTYPPALQQLARGIVEKRLAYLLTFGGFVLDGCGPENEESIEGAFERLVDAALAHFYGDVSEAQLDAFKARVSSDLYADAGAALSGAREQAGFLVGLELGRRLAPR